MQRYLSFLFSFVFVFPYAFASEKTVTTISSKQINTQLVQGAENQNLAKKYFLEGKAAFDAGNYSKALELFRKSLFEDPQNPVLNHLMGRAAFELGHFEEALFAYERVLVLNPNLALSRLEKARTHLALGSKLEAKEEFKRVLEADLPEQVRANVENFLAQIGSDRKHEVSGVVMFNHLWDSNATLGTGALPFPGDNNFNLIAPPSKQSDRIFSVAAIFNHKFPLIYEGWAWKNNATLFVSDNVMISSNDLNLGLVSTGLEFSYKRHLLDAAVNWTGINLNQNTFQSSVGGSLKYSYAFSPRVTFRSGGAYSRRHHFAPTGPSAIGTSNHFGFNNMWDFGFAFLQDAVNSWDLSYTQKFDKSPRDGVIAQSYHRHEVNLKYSRALLDRLILNLSGSRRKDTYRNEDLITGKIRSDLARSGSLGLSFKVTPSMMIDLTGSYIDNNSNLPENTYMVKQLALSFTSLIGPY